MVEYLWGEQSPAHVALLPGRQGALSGKPGVTLAGVKSRILQVMARRGQWAATAEAAKIAFRVAAPISPSASFGKAATLVWSGPEQFYAVGPRNIRAATLDTMSTTFGGVASLADQSAGRFHLRISGTRVRETLAKLCSLDLYDRTFPIGAAATTSIEHTGITLWRSPDNENGSAVFEILMFASFAESICNTFLTAAGEYGCEVGTQIYAEC